MTIYSLDVLLSLFGTRLFHHAQFYLLLLDQHTDFSGGRSGGLVFPSLEKFPQFVVIHIVKGFGIVNKAEVDVRTGLKFLKPTFYSYLYHLVDIRLLAWIIVVENSRITLFFSFTS